MREADLGQRSQTRQCLTCRDRRCIGHCRFAKPIGKRTPMPLRDMSDEPTTLPRLYRSPTEPFHWFAWTGEGWFRFRAKVDGWAERCTVTNVSRDKLQRVPLRMAFKTGLIESFRTPGPKSRSMTRSEGDSRSVSANAVSGTALARAASTPDDHARRRR